MKKIIGGIIVVIVLAVLGLQIDDDLEPAVAKLLDKAHTNKESNAYLFLMGIDASEKDNPILIGQAVYSSIFEGEEAYLAKKSDFNYQGYPQENRLPLPDGDLFCRHWEEGCLTKLFDSNNDIEEALASNSVLLSRYKAFNKYDEYSTLSRPMITEPFPPYQYIAKGSRLIVLKSINEARSLNYKKALDLLSENISNLRKQLALQDNLIGKLVFLMQVSENIDVAFLISKQSDQRYLFDIPYLTKDEKDFEILMAREFAMSYELFRDLDRNSEFWKEGSNVPGWLVRVAFKPSMSINSIYPVYNQAIEYALLSHGEFSKKIADGNTLELKESMLRNSAGVMLSRISLAGYNQYVARFYDLDAKIVLFNALAGKRDVEPMLDQVINPYDNKSSSFFFSETNKNICFDGPLQNERNLRCLRVAL